MGGRGGVNFRHFHRLLGYCKMMVVVHVCITSRHLDCRFSANGIGDGLPINEFCLVSVDFDNLAHAITISKGTYLQTIRACMSVLPFPGYAMD